MATLRAPRPRCHRQDSAHPGTRRLTQDDILYDAALRNLQTLSEATQHLPADKKAGCPQIPWHDIAGFRNILVHNYLGDIDPPTVAAVIERHLPPLETCVRAMLAEC
ncbi:DUF86 domain-containing protein [Ottowia sp.]|uniref:HepT-like ribonuclease domain-containing protein n=1 Tax=Ottowia sp. TaxID=1898956 RepID=UPI0039E6296C